MADNQQKDQETTDQTKETAVADPAIATPETSEADNAESSTPVEAELPAAKPDAPEEASAPGDEAKASTDTAPAAVAEAEKDDPPPSIGNGYQAPPPVGYTGEIVGDVIKLEDLDSPEEEARLTTYDELRALVEKTLTNVSAHEIVTGRVVSIGEKDVVIDIGFKSDGIISKSEFDHELESGEEVEVYLERIEDYHGQLVLSKSKADKVKRWRRIEDAFENEEVLEGTIVRRIKGGMIVELFEGVEAFLPGSQIDVRPVRDFDAYLEKRMEFKIVKLNPANENIVVSHKALIEKDLESQRAKILGTMEPGQILEGIVKNITDFGVFIDLGGVDGLLHITDLSWGRVSHPSELVGLDEKLNIVVLDYDKERQRISLGLKQLQPHPWDNIGERYTEDDTVEGKVVSITDYGAFVELEKGIEGLVHISEMSWTEHIKHPSQMVSLGQMVNVKILNIDNEGKKISLGMKQLEPDPWANIAERYPPGTVLNGSVRNITSFGVFVEIEPGIDGLVHISDLSWTKKVRHPSEIVKKGQDLDVVVLNIDAGDRRISLGHKQVETNPWNQFAEVYAEGGNTDATVVRIEDKGIIVRLPLDVEAYLPGSETKSGAEAFRTSYSEGDPLEGLMIVKCDPSQKEIIVSEVATEQEARRTVRDQERRQERKEKDSERQAVKAYQKRSSSTSGPTTLGELSGLDALKKKMEAAEEKADEEAEKIAEPAAAAAAEPVTAEEVAAEPVKAEEVAIDDPGTPATPDVETSDTVGDLAEVEVKDSDAAIDSDAATVADPTTEDVAEEETKPKAKRKSAAKKKE